MMRVVLIAFLFAAPALAQPTLSSHPQTGLMADLTFRPESTAVTSNSSLALSRVAGWARENPDGLVVLDGYSDYAGPAQLGVARATSVRDTLIAAGVEPARIVVAVFSSQTHPRHVSVWVTHADFGAVEAWTASRGGRALPHPLL